MMKMISGKELHSRIIAKLLLLQNKRIEIDDKVNKMKIDKVEPTKKELKELLNEIEKLFPNKDSIDELRKHRLWDEFIKFEEIISSVDIVTKNSYVKPMIVLEKLLNEIDVDAGIIDKKYCFEDGNLIELVRNKKNGQYDKHILASKKELNHTGLDEEF